jgi:AmpD protein
MTKVNPLPPNGRATQVDALWDQGWYRFAAHLPSPNFGPRPGAAIIDLIVLHSISLPPGKYGGLEVAKLFSNQLDWDAHPYFKPMAGLTVSSHFFIRRNGDLQQFVSTHERAWHAGTSHYRGRSNCNDDSIGIELEGLEGDPFEAPQYGSLHALCAALLCAFPIAHIAGHEHIAPGRKADPGSGFDWAALQQGLGLDARYFPFSLGR